MLWALMSGFQIYFEVFIQKLPITFCISNMNIHWLNYCYFKFIPDFSLSLMAINRHVHLVYLLPLSYML